MNNISFTIIDALRNGRFDEIYELIEFHQIDDLNSDELFLFGLNLAYIGKWELLKLLNEEYGGLKDKRYNGEILIPFSSDIEIGVTLIGQTILGYNWSGHDTIKSLEFLIHSSFNVNGITFSGYTELQLAIAMSAKPHAKLLLESGADPFKTSNDLDKPNAFDIAKNKKWAEEMLSKYRSG